MDKKQSVSAMVKETTAELTIWKVEEHRRSCNPQSILTNSLTPSTTADNTSAIFQTQPIFSNSQFSNRKFALELCYADKRQMLYAVLYK